MYSSSSVMEKASTFKNTSLSPFNPEGRRLLIKNISPHFLESALRMIKFENLPETLNQLREIYRPSSIITFVAFHRSHAEGLIAAQTQRALRVAFPETGNMYLPIASSLKLGLQGKIPKFIFEEGIEPFLAQDEIKILPVTTPNDIKKRKLKPKPSDGKAMIAAITEPNSTIFTLPESSVNGGRHRKILGLPIGKINGSQQFYEESLWTLAKKSEKAERELIIVPIGISGTNDILSADFFIPGFKALLTYIKQRIGIESTIAKATYGQPFVVKLADFENPTALSNFIVSKMNPLIPANERGSYSKLNYQ